MSILFIMSGNHPFHNYIAKLIGADIFEVGDLSPKHFTNAFNTLKIPSGYDYYITESNYYTLWRKKFNLDGKLINLMGGPILYFYYSNHLPYYKKIVLEMFRDIVDAEILIGTKWVDIHKQFFGNLPFTSIPPLLLKDFRTVQPELNSHTMCVVANIDWYYKGLDLLFEAFSIAKKSIPELKLNVIGKISYPKPVPSGVSFLGRVPSLSPEFSKCSLYVHPARGEVYGLSILEAMSAGLPVLISDQTGASEDLKDEFPSAILPLDPSKFAEAIVNYYSLPLDSRESLSAKSRKFALRFLPEYKSSEIKSSITKFLNYL